MHDTRFSLKEFDERRGFEFSHIQSSDNFDDLLSLLEYIFNLTNNARELLNRDTDIRDGAIAFFVSHIAKICDKIVHEFFEKNDYFILVQSNQAALEATQTLSEEDS